MRGGVDLKTYNKIRELFSKNKAKDFSKTSIREALKVDWFSIAYVLNLLLKEKFIVEKDSRYKLRGK